MSFGLMDMGFRDFGKKLTAYLGKTIDRAITRAVTHARGYVTGGTLFEELGFYHIGPIDGHSFDHLLPVLRNVRDNQKGPVLIHVVTQKGKGYAPAEAAADKYHGVNKFDVITGAQAKAKPNAPSYTSVFAEALIQEATLDDKIIGVTAAMPNGTGLDKMAELFPSRTFDVGIAEQHAVTFAAGLAADGYKPFCALYSTFLQRAYDQLIHDISVQGLDVTFAIDRAGIVGADGPTHQGAFDLSFLRCVPGMTVFAPADEAECRNMLYTAFLHPGPTAVRYPRGSGPGVAENQQMTQVPIGKAQLRREGREVALLAFGSMLAPALEAGEDLDATVVNMRSVKPLDAEMIKQLADTHELLVTVEENSIRGGAGAGVAETLAQYERVNALLMLGLPDKHIEQGDPAEVLAQCGLDATGIVKSVRHRLSDKLAASRHSA